MRLSGVYFLASGDQVKIGHSSNVALRISQIRRLGPSTAKARLIGCVPGSLDEEKALHERFEQYRVRGEWFRHDGGLLEFTRALASPPNIHIPRSKRRSEDLESANFRLPVSLLDELRRKSKENGMFMERLVANVLRAGLKAIAAQEGRS